MQNNADCNQTKIIQMEIEIYIITVVQGSGRAVVTTFQAGKVLKSLPSIAT